MTSIQDLSWVVYIYMHTGSALDCSNINKYSVKSLIIYIQYRRKSVLSHMHKNFCVSSGHVLYTGNSILSQCTTSSSNTMEAFPLYLKGPFLQLNKV